METETTEKIKGRDGMGSGSSPFLLGWSIVVVIRYVVSGSATPWTVAFQAPLSMGFFQARILEYAAISFSRRSSWNKGLNLRLLQWQADSLLLIHLGSLTSRMVGEGITKTVTW